MRLSRKYTYGLLALTFILAVGLLSLWVAAQLYGPKMAHRIETALENWLERPVRVERAVFRLWLGRLGLDGVTIAAGPTWDDGTLLRLGRAEVRVGISSLWRRELVMSRIFFQDVDLKLSPPDPGSPESHITLAVPERIAFGPITVIIKAITLANGRILYEDQGSRQALEIVGLRATVRPQKGGADAHFRAERFRLQWANKRTEIDRLAGEARLVPEQLILRSFAFHWQGKKFAVAGKVEQPWNKPELALTVNGEVPLEWVAHQAALPWKIKGSPRLAAVLNGSPYDPQVTAELSAPELTVGPVTVGQLGLQGTWQGTWKDGVLQVKQFTGRIFDGRLDGSLLMMPSQPAQTRIAVRLEKASLAALGAGGAQGAVSLEGTIRGDLGRFESLHGAMRVEVASLSLPKKASQLGVGSVQVEATLNDGMVTIDRASGTWPSARLETKGRFAEKTLHLTELTIQAGESRIAASGNASWKGTGFPDLENLDRRLQFKLDLSPSSVRMEDLAKWFPQAADAQGQVTVSGKFGGTWSAWQGGGTIASKALTVRGSSLGDLRSEFNLDPQNIEIKNLQTVFYGMPVKAQGVWSWKGDGSGSAQVGPVELAELVGLQESGSIAGRGEGRLQAAFRGGKAELSGTVLTSGVKAYGVPLGKGTVNLALQGDRLKANLSFPEVKLSGTAGGDLTGARVVTAELKVEQLNLDGILRRALEEHSAEVSGLASGEAVLSIPLDQPSAGRGIARLHPVRLVVPGIAWETRSPIVVRWERDLIQLESFELHGAGGVLVASGWMKPPGSVELRMGGTLPLALLPSIEPRVREAAGTLEIEGRLRGSMKAPTFAGQGSVKGGSFLLRDYPQTFRDVNANFTLSPQSLRLVEATGGLGSGRVTARGELLLSGWEISQYRFTFGLRNFGAELVNGLQSVWDADLEWVSAMSGGYLRGETRLVRGSYTRDLALLSLLLASETENGGGTTFNLPLQILVKLQDNLLVRNQSARVRIGGNLTVEGTTQSPVVFGTLKAGEGQFTVRRNRFALTSASARFTDPRRINPFLEVKGKARIQDYDVSVHLSGYADEVNIVLSSTPPLPQEDLLSLVAFGMTRERLGESGAGVLAGEAAQFLVQDLLGIQSSTAGLDVLEVQRDGEAGETVRVGKKITERAFLLYSQNLGESEERRIRVEYQLFGPLLIAGEQNFRGGFGGDLVLRLRFR